MKIERFRVVNYKSYAESPWIEPRGRFTVIVGKNNSGKTAILEALRLEGNNDAPHRDLTMRASAAHPPQSKFEVVVQFEDSECFDAFQNRGTNIEIPYDSANMGSIGPILESTLKGQPTLGLVYRGGSGPQSLSYPSHGLFKSNNNPRFVRLIPSEDREKWERVGEFDGADDTLPILFQQTMRNKVFYFEARRTAPAEIGFGNSGTLSPDASNLPSALFAMMDDPALWDQFNRHINEVIPSVRRVVPKAAGSNIAVSLWPVDTSTKRKDLVTSLAQGGSGVGQVLSIICAALTREKAIIAIDEPANFLHPGAVKSLMRVLNQYDHQYIITTHSIDVFSAVIVDKIYLVTHADCISNVEEVALTEVDQNRRILADLGVGYSDISGISRVLWVEGETEEICFPIVIQHKIGYMPSNLSVLRVRGVEEVLSMRGREVAMVDIYDKLTSSGGLIPRNMRFLFDREQRKDSVIEKIEKKRPGILKFLARRTYENYIIDFGAIAAEITAQNIGAGLPEVGEEDVRDWIMSHGNDLLKNGELAYEILSPEWFVYVDAPKMLNNLFNDLGKSEYKKTKNSPSITRRIISENPSALKELEKVVLEAIEFH